MILASAIFTFIHLFLFPTCCTSSTFSVLCLIRLKVPWGKDMLLLVNINDLCLPMVLGKHSNIFISERRGLQKTVFRLYMHFYILYSWDCWLAGTGILESALKADSYHLSQMNHLAPAALGLLLHSYWALLQPSCSLAVSLDKGWGPCPWVPGEGVPGDVGQDSYGLLAHSGTWHLLNQVVFFLSHIRAWAYSGKPADANFPKVKCCLINSQLLQYIWW